MTKQELIDECSQRIALLKEVLDTPTIEYDFFNGFTRMYNIKNIAGLLKIPYVDLTTALLYVQTDISSFETLFDDTISFSAVLDNLSSEDLGHTNDIIMAFIRRGNVMDQLRKYFEDTNTKRAISQMKDDFKYETMTADDHVHMNKAHDMMEFLILNNGKEGWDILKLIDYYDEHSKIMNNIVSIITILKGIEEDKADYNSKEFKTLHRTDHILEFVSSINAFKIQMNDFYKKRNLSKEHEITVYKKFLRDMESAFKKDEIINYEYIVHDLKDEELKVEFLKLVYEHNKTEYDEIDAIHDKLTKNSLVNYLAILKSNGIKKDEVDLSKVMRNSCDDLDKMLKTLNGVVEDKNVILRIIEFSDLATVKYFKELKSKNVLGNNAFTKYPDIFNASSEHRKALDEGIKVIEKYGVDYSLFLKHPNILIENSNLSNNLELLSSYRLLGKLKDTRKLAFLCRDNLVDIIDKIIELGYDEYLENELDLLNENNWERIYVLKTMGLLPTDRQELVKYLRDDKFFVSKDRLKFYIEDVSTYSDNFEVSSDVNVDEFILENTISDRVLDINGVSISKNRVLRNIKDGKNLFSAIISDSILNVEEVKKIKKKFKHKVYKID